MIRLVLKSISNHTTQIIILKFYNMEVLQFYEYN